MTKLNNIRSDEKGNALFLILIAVVLFAALSYAITQSNRGSGAPNRETSLISSTTVTQYTSAIRTGITRMMLRNVTIANLKFWPPTSASYGTDTTNEVFHPSGGGVSFAPVDINTVEALDTGNSTTNPFRMDNWYFVTDKNVEKVGTATGDVVAMLVDVKRAICERINEQISGSITIPVAAQTEAALLGAGGAISDAGTVLDAQSFYCMKPSDTSRYIYYHVLAEQ